MTLVRYVLTLNKGMRSLNALKARIRELFPDMTSLMLVEGAELLLLSKVDKCDPRVDKCGAQKNACLWVSWKITTQIVTSFCFFVCQSCSGNDVGLRNKVMFFGSYQFLWNNLPSEIHSEATLLFYNNLLTPNHSK